MVRRRMFIAGALTVLLAGIAGSVLGSGAIASSLNDRAERRFHQEAGHVVAHLRLSIVHETDLIGDTTAFALGSGQLTTSALRRWVDEGHVSQRYPELRSLAIVRYVSAADLPAFQEQTRLDPPVPLPADGTYTIVPAGDRPYYCLGAAVGYTAPDMPLLPAGFDFCESPLRDALLTSISSGDAAYSPVNDGTQDQLVVFTPMFTGSDEKRALVGWVGLGVKPDVVLRDIVNETPDLAITFRHRDAYGTVAFRRGSVEGHAESTTEDFGAGWSVIVSHARPARGLFDHDEATAVLLGGIGASVLVGLLILLAGRLSHTASRLRVSTEELRSQATHDALTGLPNRLRIIDELHRRLGHGTNTAALYVDLDDFKAVNDALGHEVGDQLLRATAARLTGCMRDSDLVGRLGGDEFVVILGGDADRSTTEAVAMRLIEVMRAPFHLTSAPGPIRVTVTIGAALRQGCTADDLLRDADLALYQAKAAGKNRIHVFHPAMAEQQKQRFELLLGLATALENDQFRLVYQPIWSIDDERLVGIEALLRWDHPAFGLLRPDEFMGALEATGHVVDVGRWVLREACRQLAEWHQVLPYLTVAVNASARQFADDAIIRDVREALVISGVPAHALTIEITETALMAEPSVSAARLEALRALGCRIAIDDFGVGYSSLSYLQSFPADVLKIDRSFISGLSRSPDSLSLVRTIVTLAADMQLTTLAEGVETEEQLAILRDQNVELAQGFLVSPPLPPEQFASTILEAHRQRFLPTPTSPSKS